jgi:hypothetical protein
MNDIPPARLAPPLAQERLNRRELAKLRETLYERITKMKPYQYESQDSFEFRIEPWTLLFEKISRLYEDAGGAIAPNGDKS